MTLRSGWLALGSLAAICLFAADAQAQAQGQAQAQPQPQLGEVSESAEYRLCWANSTSPRGRGLIVTPVFESRTTDLEWLRRAFIGYLSRSFAPYGNNWVFEERQATCSAFGDRRTADDRRAVMLGRTRQAGQQIYEVPFTL